MRIVLDTNILVSAALFTGNEFEIIRRVEAGEFSLILSPEIVEEFGRVLSRSKFGLSEAEVSALLEHLLSISEIVIPRRKKTHKIRDEEDRIILECALTGGAKYIVSGDQDLQALRRVGRVRIVSSREFLEKHRWR